MQNLFLWILDMSIVASIVIIAVLVVRLFLKRAPKIYSYILWAVVLFRLLCPFTIESALSLIPEQARNIPQEMALEETEHVSAFNALDAAQRSLGDVVNGGIDYTIWIRLDSESEGVQGISYARHWQVWLLFFGFMWPVGMTGMVLYGIISYVKLRRKLVGAVHLDGNRNPIFLKEPNNNVMTNSSNIYLADHITSPFVMGVIRPKIYLPSSLAEYERGYIIMHEQYHIRRGDHVVKLLAFVALCIHWFNPLVWVAFIQAGKDMEMSCDEAVVKKQGGDIRAEYSASLLSLATGKRIFAGMPLAFGEGDTKGRIKNLGNWKKPKIWISVIAILICIIVAAVCIVDPKEDTRLNPAEVVGEYDVSRLGGNYLESGNPAYEIGTNAYGMPVFADYKAALRTMQEEYAEALQYIEEQFELPSFSKRNYQIYKIYGAQVVTGEEELRKDCVAVSQFLDIYENSFDYSTRATENREETVGDTSEIPSESGKIVPGATYVSYSCLYMNLLSSTMGNGDSGYRYVVGEDSFTLIGQNTGNKTTYASVDWGWQPFPWTDEQWSELYFPGQLNTYNISEYYEEMLYQPISEGCCLLSMDGELWLINMHKTPQKEPYIWSIYTLVPEAAMGSAVWEYKPYFSSRYPAFRFVFDMPYTEISATCTESKLISFDNNEMSKRSEDYSLIVDENSDLYWSPVGDDTAQLSSAQIYFSIFNNEEMISSGTIYITRQSDGVTSNGTQSGSATENIYRATIVGNGLYMSQNEDYPGAVISLR